MLLYHGTHSGRLGGILREGLKPRGTGAGNWRRCPSRPEYVYLTDAYAAYFALMCDDANPDDYGGKMPVPAIVEVDASRLDASRFYPDEDFISQSLWAIQQSKQLSCLTLWQRRLIKNCKTMGAIHERVDPARFQNFWQASLAMLGNVAHRGPIPATAITRYAQIDPALCRQIRRLACDASVCTGSYAVLADQYRSLIAHIFDGERVRIFAERELSRLHPEQAARREHGQTAAALIEARHRQMQAEWKRGVRVEWR